MWSKSFVDVQIVGSGRQKILKKKKKKLQCVKHMQEKYGFNGLVRNHTVAFRTPRAESLGLCFALALSICFQHETYSSYSNHV